LGRKGISRHLKRKPAPKLWPIHRKEAVWTVNPEPGSHSIKSSIPLALVVRDLLGFAQTAKEAKNIISSGKIMVDGKVRCNERFLVGLMDIISLVGTNKSYRVLPSGKGLFLNPIDSSDTFKLYRIENKSVVKGGKTNLDLHDGTNYQTQEELGAKTSFSTLDVLKLSVPDRELLGQSKLAVGSPIIVIGGKNMGKNGKVVEIEKQADKKRRDLLVTLNDAKGEQFQTILDFVFVVGDTDPSITLPEEN
jgi:small subunit ribosomal protein S4e